MESALNRFETRLYSSGFKQIAGVDEAGRGPLAGPVIAAAVVLPPDYPIDGINDSKKLTPKQRDRMFDRIYRDAVAVETGRVDAADIDRINILQASLKAMAVAVSRLSPAADYLLVDGTFPIPSSVPQEPIPKGDSRSVSIAAASIVAKVTRDRIMADYHADYPAYGFDRHKGYPTKAHKTAIARHGACPIHRRSFKGVVGAGESTTGAVSD